MVFWLALLMFVSMRLPILTLGTLSEHETRFERPTLQSAASQLGMTCSWMFGVT